MYQVPNISKGYGASIPPRYQTFSKENAGKQIRPNIYFPTTQFSKADPKLLYVKPHSPCVTDGDPITRQRKFMVSPNPMNNIDAQRFQKLVNFGHLTGQNMNPINPLSKFGINLHDRLGPFGLADFKQRAFLTQSNY
jgi:hypothetical protein